jgi:transcriptional regulator with PAS, ATPase and Fis domain
MRNSRAEGDGESQLPLRKQVENLERRLIRKALLRHKTTREAAKVLGVSQATLVQKMQRWERSD